MRQYFKASSLRVICHYEFLGEHFKSVKGYDLALSAEGRLFVRRDFQALSKAS